MKSSELDVIHRLACKLAQDDANLHNESFMVVFDGKDYYSVPEEEYWRGYDSYYRKFDYIDTFHPELY